MHDLRSLTTAQIVRTYNKTFDIFRRNTGGPLWGWDYPTLWAVYPGWANVLRSLRLEMLRRLHS